MGAGDEGLPAVAAQIALRAVPPGPVLYDTAAITVDTGPPVRHPCFDQERLQVPAVNRYIIGYGRIEDYAVAFLYEVIRSFSSDILFLTP